MIERVREIMRDPEHSELRCASLTWRSSAGERSVGPFTVVTLTVRDGQTTLTIADRLNQLAGVLFTSTGGGGLFALGAVTAEVPALTTIFLLPWLAIVYAGTRVLFRRAARRRAAPMQQLFDALILQIEARIADGRDAARRGRP